MIIRKSFKYKLRLRGSREGTLLRQAGCCRFVWNKMLALNNARLRRGQRVLGWYDMNRLLPLLRRWYPFLANDAFARSLQQVCRSLHVAFERAFDKSDPNRRPRFKKKREYAVIRYPEELPVSGNAVRIPKVGWVRFFNSREIEGVIKNTSIVRESSGWFVSFQCEQDTNIEPRSGGMVGIDLGVVRFATLSDGTVIEPKNPLRRQTIAIREASKSLSRKVKFSGRWEKERRRLSKLHSKVARSRMDFLQKASTAIVRDNQAVVVEALSVCNLVASARGTVESPGSNTQAKAGLNRAILDQGWSMFVKMLRYKLAWSGGVLLTVSPHYTSQTCPRCRHVSAESRRSQAEFICVKCGHTENADAVAAKNILRAGQALRREDVLCPR